MKDKEKSPPEQKSVVSRLEEEKQALAQKLAKALRENTSLYERLAELDITMNIKTTELKKGVENLSAGRDDLLEENESLLKELSLKELKIQDLLRTSEIKQLLLEETNGHLIMATQQMKEWQSSHRDLETLLESIKREKTVLEEEKETREGEIQTLLKGIQDLKSSLEEKSENIASLSESLENLRSALSHNDDAFPERVRTEIEAPLALKDGEIERLRELHESALKKLSEEHEDLLNQRNVEIERLSGDLQRLKEQYESLSRENEGVEKGILDARIRVASLEEKLSEREDSLKELEEKLSG
ncbi:MAG TPA: hypothetical protein DCP92_13585, partial [Nitrospiraceae bacterium]|nr:hypothetical protein [Nitrospiraceae bacterium]